VLTRPTLKWNGGFAMAVWRRRACGFMLSQGEWQRPRGRMGALPFRRLSFIVAIFNKT
jgi:hypothetical protein